MARSQQHAIIRNGRDVIAVFPSHILAEEAFYDLGCYLDDSPTPEDQFTIEPYPGKVCPVFRHITGRQG